MTDKPASTRPARYRSPPKQAVDWISNRVFRAALWVMLRLPWRARVECAGALASYVVAPLAGWRRRIRQNLASVLPDLPEAEVRHILRQAPANLGRAFIEIYSAEEFIDRVRHAPLSGPGLPALEKAKAEGRTVMLVTGHIGNYDAMRAALIARGYPMGGLFKHMANPHFNDHYIAAIEKIGTPLFPRDRRGMGDMLRFLRGGGMLGIVTDQWVAHGAPLTFMGKTALTALSAAELALKFDAVVIPTYGIRRADHSFELILSDEIPKGTAEEMTQAMNDDLERQVRAHPEQWIWMHRRWRPVPPSHQRP